jgi:DNA-binding transcriptional LysR family regulator
MLTMTENLERELKRIDAEDEGILKIGSSHIPTSEIIYQSIVDFKAKYPGTYIIYELNDTENISYMVENELLDIGFIGAVTQNHLDFESFSGDELRLVAHKDFDVPDKIDIGGLKNIPLILNQKESGVRKFLLQKLEESKISVSELNIISEIGLPEALIRFVRLGMGCAFIPSILLDREMQKDDLKVIRISDFSASRNYYMVTKKGIQISALAMNFRELFLSSVQNRTGEPL